MTNKAANKVEVSEIPSMTKDQKTGLFVNDKTGLVPVICVKPVPEKGWSRGDTFGVNPEGVEVLVKNSIATLHPWAKGEFPKAA